MESSTHTPSPDASDEQLVAMLNAGNTEAFEVLFERYHGWGLRLALRFVRDDALAADAVQDAFVYLLGKFPGFELRARLTTFLYPVIKHNAIGAAKATRRKTPTTGSEDAGPLDSAADPGSSPASEADAAGSGGVLTRAIDALPDGQREVLLMRIVHGMGVSEVAAALDIPPGTVKSRLFHALRTLREEPALSALLGDDDAPQGPSAGDERGARASSGGD